MYYGPPTADRPALVKRWSVSVFKQNHTWLITDGLYMLTVRILNETLHAQWRRSVVKYGNQDLSGQATRLFPITPYVNDFQTLKKKKKKKNLFSKLAYEIITKKSRN